MNEAAKVGKKKINLSQVGKTIFEKKIIYLFLR
jgi:hypothetical protein